MKKLLFLCQFTEVCEKHVARGEHQARIHTHTYIQIVCKVVNRVNVHILEYVNMHEYVLVYCMS